MLGKESCKGFLEALSKMSLRMGPTWMSWCGKKKIVCGGGCARKGMGKNTVFRGYNITSISYREKKFRIGVIRGVLDRVELSKV